jgi:hypothetical protein
LNGVLKGGDYDTSREDRPDDKNYVWSHTEVRDGTVVTDEIWVCTYEKQIEVICDEPQLVCNY